MVYQLFEKIQLKIKKFIRWFIVKFFKRPLTPEKITSDFLKQASKLTHDGTVQIYRGGLRAFQESIIDDDNTVYIMVIKTRRRKKLFLEEWFKRYGTDRKW